MMARKINLGQAVIAAGGLLVVAALASVLAQGDARTWAAAFVGMILGFAGLLVLGRALGGRTAVRLGRDRLAGERAGIALAVGLPLLTITLSRWLGLA
jgi:hypothetical protein